MLKSHVVVLISTAAIHLILAIFVIVKGRSRVTNVAYAFHSICICWWSFFQAISMSAPNYSTALSIWRLNHMGVIFIPIFFVHFVLTQPHRKPPYRKFVIAFVYLIGLFFTFMNISGILIPEVEPKFHFKYFINPNPTYNIFFLFWVLCAIYGYIELFAIVVVSKTKKRKHFFYFSLSMVLAYIGGAPNFLPTYDILIPNLIPYGTYFVAFYPFVAVYVIVAHQLMEINVIFKKATVFTALFGVFYGIFTFIAFITQRIFEDYFGWNMWFAAVPAFICIIAIYDPLRKFLVNLTDKVLFQKKYDYKELLKIFTNEVLTVLDLEKVSKNTVEGLDNIIKLESCAVLLKNETNNNYCVSASKTNNNSYQLECSNPCIKRIEQSNSLIQRNQLSKNMESYGVILNVFDELKSELIIPIIYSREVIGLMSLGRKKSGDDFNKEDVDVLSTLAGTVGIAVSNAKLYAQLSQTQAEAAQSEKMAVIGTLASGINHEICNPLGIVRGHCEVFLLNFRDGLYKNIDKDKLLDQVSKTYEKIIAQIDRATGITKRLSAFAKPNKLFKKEPINAGHEVEEVLQILAHEMRIHNIEVKNELPPNYPKIMCDKKQIQEVMFNIIRNAAQAMKGNGKIQIDGARNGVQAWINIKDTGPGITPEQQAKIFHPFFTTKQPGEGTGLGLYIVKQIVEKNDGTIELSSVPGEGATFKLTFKIAEEECLKS